MVLGKQNLKPVPLERLNFDRLRNLMRELNLQAGYWTGGNEQIAALAPVVTMCKGLHATGRHCQPFLLQLARDAQQSTQMQCRSCMDGACTFAARLDNTSQDSAVVLGCRVSAGLAAPTEAPQSAATSPAEDLAWLAAAFTRVSQEWYKLAGDHAQEVEVLSESLGETYEELSFIYRLNEAMNLTASHRTYMQDLAEELRNLIAADTIIVRLLEGDVGGKDRADTIVAGQANLPVDALLEQIDRERLANRGYEIGQLETPGVAGTYQVLATPIARYARQIGLIAAFRVDPQGKFNNIDVTRVSSIAKSVAVILENFRLYDNLRNLFMGTVRALIRSIDAKDPYTCGHSERVATISRRLLLAMGGSDQHAERVYLCGLLHDIGKIGITEEVLHKPGRLTAQEYAMVKQHPPVGGAILEGIGELEDIIPGVLHHHERLDGKGYPAGLSGQNIPLFARVLAVADTFDAMTSERPYRRALSVAVAVEELNRHAGTQFDPVVVEALMGLDPNSLVVELGQRKVDERLVRGL